MQKWIAILATPSGPKPIHEGSPTGRTSRGISYSSDALPRNLVSGSIYCDAASPDRAPRLVCKVNIAAGSEWIRYSQVHLAYGRGQRRVYVMGYRRKNPVSRVWETAQLGWYEEERKFVLSNQPNSQFPVTPCDPLSMVVPQTGSGRPIAVSGAAGVSRVCGWRMPSGFGGYVFRIANRVNSDAFTLIFTQDDKIDLGSEIF